MLSTADIVLIQRYLDGETSSEENRRYAERLRTEPEFLAEHLVQSRIHAMFLLRRHAPAMPAPSGLRVFLARHFARLAAGALIFFAVSGLAGLIYRAATTVVTPVTSLQMSAPVTPVAETAGRLSATKATASTLSTGTATVQAPAEVTIVGPEDVVIMKPQTALVAVAAAAALSIAQVQADPALDPALFSKRVAISVTGYTGSESLTDFPLLVKFAAGSPAGFAYSDMAYPATGADLRFAFIDGATTNFLDHEIDTWDTNGTSTVWVRIPSFSASTAVVAFYGAWALSGQVPVGTNVWKNCIAVYHMNGTNDSSASPLHATLATNDLTAFNVAGVIGNCASNSNKTSANNLFLMPDYSAKNTDASKITFTGWFRFTDPAVNGGRLFSRKSVYQETDGTFDIFWTQRTEANSERGRRVSRRRFIRRLFRSCR